MADETTPDAVSLVHELLYAASQQGPEETDQVADRLLSAIHAERARHAEEVARLRDVHLDETRALDDLRLKEIASLRDQLRRTEGARDVATRVAADHFGTICQLRDQLRKVTAELDGERERATKMEEARIVDHSPDAVELLRALRVDNRNPVGLIELDDDEFTAICAAIVAERARHAEEVAEARRQKELWRQETASLQGAVRKLMDQLEAEEARVTSLRSLLPDVRACAEFCVSPTRGSGLTPPPGARRILAALDSQGGEGE